MAQIIQPQSDQHPNEANDSAGRKAPQPGRLSLILFILISVGAVAGAVLNRIHPFYSGMLGPCAGAAIIVCAFAALYASLQSKLGFKRALFSVSGALILVSAAEVTGLYTHQPFGGYAYTGLWWPSLSLPQGVSFPILLPFTWFILLLACYSLVNRRFTGALAVLIAALLVTVVDVVLEPVLTGPVGFWHWLPPARFDSPPIQNYLAWFGVSLLAFAFWQWLGVSKFADRRLQWILFLTIVFTIVIGCAYSIWQSALIGVPLIAACVWIGFRKSAAA